MSWETLATAATRVAGGAVAGWEPMGQLLTLCGMHPQIKDASEKGAR